MSTSRTLADVKGAHGEKEHENRGGETGSGEEQGGGGGGGGCAVDVLLSDGSAIHLVSTRPRYIYVYVYVYIAYT